jgi:hypothetical protein
MGTTMSRSHFLPRVLSLALLIAFALLSWSCEGGGGVGVGVGTPTRWGGGTSGPPIFVGGPQ